MEKMWILAFLIVMGFVIGDANNFAQIKSEVNALRVPAVEPKTEIEPVTIKPTTATSTATTLSSSNAPATITNAGLSQSKLKDEFDTALKTQSNSNYTILGAKMHSNIEEVSMKDFGNTSTRKTGIINKKVSETPYYIERKDIPVAIAKITPKAVVGHMFKKSKKQPVHNEFSSDLNGSKKLAYNGYIDSVKGHEKKIIQNYAAMGKKINYSPSDGHLTISNYSNKGLLGKLRIADFYPVSIEKFNPIVHENSESTNLAKQRTISTKTREKALKRQAHELNLKAKAMQLNKHTVVDDSFITSRKINHPPLFRTSAAVLHHDTISDFTGKVLAEQDGAITEIEKKFQLNEFVVTDKSEMPITEGAIATSASSPSTMLDREVIDNKTKGRSRTSFTVNHKTQLSINPGFIDRRVKKSFGLLMHRTEGDKEALSHVDIANTKFKIDLGGNASKAVKTAPLVQSDLRPINASEGPAGARPEFSTTKFYNSKELYNELMQKRRKKKININDTVSITTKVSGFIGRDATEEASAASRFGMLHIQSKKTSPKQEATLSATLSNYVVAKLNTTKGKSSSSLMGTTIDTVKNRSTEFAFQISTPTPLIKIKKNQKELKRVNSLLKTIIVVPKTSSTEKTTIQTQFEKSTNNTILAAHAKKQSSPIQAIQNIRSSFDSSLKLNNLAKRITSNTTNIINPDIHEITNESIAERQSAIKTEIPTNIQILTTTVTETSTTPQHTTNPSKVISKPVLRSRVLSRLEEKINSLDCDVQTLPQDSHLWRGNETHELLLPVMTPKNCLPIRMDCSPLRLSWEGEAEIQSGDILIVEINDALLSLNDGSNTSSAHNTQVYQVTRSGHEHCDVTEGILLDITPLVVDGRKLVTLYDKDLTEGINLLIVVSELWGPQCVRLKVITKTDNCGENAECSGKGVCYSNTALEEYECQCCTGFTGPHCEEIDACTPSPCTNNGICVDLSQGHEGNSYQCLCPYGYAGKNCQYESDPCNSAECMNSGSCVGNSTHFRCDCAPGYTGSRCQHSLNECESSPCMHGICVDQEDGFRCFCQPGFAGELCNFEYNECESNPCQNEGECIDHIGSYECHCTKGFTGARCQIKVDFCTNKPCPNGHRCIDHGNDFSCECPGGHNGPDCNQIPRTQCNVNPCTHGGTCWSSGDSFYCACRPGYTGTMCEDEFVVETVVSSSEFMVDDTGTRNFNDKNFGSSVVLKSPIELHNAYFAAGVLAAAVFIVAIVVTICHCKVNQTYRKFSTRSTPFFPILGFGRRHKAQSKLNKHWLSGKGINSGNSLRSSASSASLTRGHLFSNHSSGSTTTLAQHNQVGQLHERPFQRHLAMNLENDMYYTVDFSENSQHSPLIQ